jgi:hypothetical protein
MERRMVAGRGRNEALLRLVSAVLSVFSGPLIESTFNIMDDIIENDRTALCVENYEAIALIKYALRAKNLTNVSMTIDHKMRRMATSAYNTYVDFQQNKKAKLAKVMEKRIEKALVDLAEKTLKLKNKRKVAVGKGAVVSGTGKKPHKTTCTTAGPAKEAVVSGTPLQKTANCTIQRQPVSLLGWLKRKGDTISPPPAKSPKLHYLSACQQDIESDSVANIYSSSHM